MRYFLLAFLLVIPSFFVIPTAAETTVNCEVVGDYGKVELYLDQDPYPGTETYPVAVFLPQKSVDIFNATPGIVSVKPDDYGELDLPPGWSNDDVDGFGTTPNSVLHTSEFFFVFTTRTDSNTPVLIYTEGEFSQCELAWVGNISQVFMPTVFGQ